MLWHQFIQRYFSGMGHGPGIKAANLIVRLIGIRKKRCRKLSGDLADITRIQVLLLQTAPVVAEIYPTVPTIKAGSPNSAIV